VHYYEVLCLDAARTRSAWLCHPTVFDPTTFQTMLTDVINTIPAARVRTWIAENQSGDTTAITIAKILGVQSDVTQDIEHRFESATVALNTVFGLVIDLLCERYHFSRMIPQAVAVFHGAETVRPAGRS